MKKVCVVIPIHKAKLDDSEKISLEKVSTILGKNDLFLLSPKGLDVSEYVKINHNLSVIFVNQTWLSSIKEYNKMKINVSFYELFKDYKYMLTYELDSYIFRDELSLWCQKEYDYIGAPWFPGFDKANPNATTIGVGNSGFSLRNIQSCLNILSRLNTLVTLTKAIDFPPLNYSLRYITALEKVFPFVRLTKIKIMRSFLTHEYVHEDIFWSIFIPHIFPAFKIAPVSEALQFSFDANPKKCFELTNEKLPFGCHAWPKFGGDFWDKYIY